MGKKNYEKGSSRISQFWSFINERHSIWHRRFIVKNKAPWTKDPILREYKFTNVFRELDRGTIYLRRMLKGREKEEKLVTNIIWYRMFNWWEHAIEPGYCKHFRDLETSIMCKAYGRKPVFTNAHLTWAPEGRPKHRSYLIELKKVYDNAGVYYDDVFCEDTMEGMFDLLLRSIPGMGPFITYEIVCDLRWYFDVYDQDLWCNIGPGAKRGLERLGLPPTIESCRDLLDDIKRNTFAKCHAVNDNVVGKSWPPFELREIEHCLCEFDKYERVRTGVGRPRQRFKPNEDLKLTWD